MPTTHVSIKRRHIFRPPIQRRRSAPAHGLLGALTCVAALACTPRAPGDDGFAATLAAAIAAREGDILSVSDVATFPWDLFCAFEPYTTRTRAEELMGMPWRYRWSSVERMDDRNYVVFARGGRVVVAFDHPRGLGDFSGAASGCWSPGRARFHVARVGTRSDGRPAYRLTPAEGEDRDGS